jgi:glycosyltransferase involved in cell wall biosynthesis
MRLIQARLATGVITYSNGGRRRVGALAPRADVRVVTNTTGRASPGDGDLLTRVNRSIAFVGRMQARKHLDRLLRALLIAREQGTEIHADLVGEGPCAQTLRELARDLGVDDLCSWHGAVNDWNELKAILHQNDLVVMPAHAGLGLVDGFAAARGAVVPDDSAMSPPEAEAVVDGITGFRYAPATVAGLAATLVRAYSEPTRLFNISLACSKLYNQTMTLDYAVTQFVRAIDDMSLPSRERR